MSVQALRGLDRHRFFFDPYGIHPGQRLANGQLAEIATFGMVEAVTRQFIPTYGIERSEVTWQHLPALIALLNSGFAFRVLSRDIEQPEDTWEQILFRSGQLRLDMREIDVLIDLREISGMDVDRLTDLVTDFLSQVPRNLRSIALLATSAKKDATEVALDEVGRFPRLELELWARLQYELGSHVNIAFGDYAISHPDVMIAGPNKNANAKIRYTAGRHLYYFRGHGLHTPKSDFAQYHSLARKVVASEHYYGPDFSWGDATIFSKCGTASTPGNLGTWVKIDSNHHMTVVAEQLQEISLPLVNSTSLYVVEKILNSLD